MVTRQEFTQHKGFTLLFFTFLPYNSEKKQDKYRNGKVKGDIASLKVRLMDVPPYGT